GKEHQEMRMRKDHEDFTSFTLLSLWGSLYKYTKLQSFFSL
ncbi:unnamed protein product, partial [marine sediment metagenome]